MFVQITPLGLNIISSWGQMFNKDIDRKTTRHRAIIFGSNCTPGARNGPAPGVNDKQGLYRENLKKSSSLKPEGLDY